MDIGVLTVVATDLRVPEEEIGLMMGGAHGMEVAHVAG